MSNILLAYRFVTEGTARITGFEDTARQMWDVVYLQWRWTIRAAVATVDIRAAILVPITAVFGYLAFRIGLARPTAAIAGQRIV